MANIPIVMPQMGESLADGTLVKWLKNVGDSVAQDEPLFEISTDKVDTDVPSPVAGILREIVVQEGQTVDIGVTVAFVGTEDAPALSDSGMSRRGEGAGQERPAAATAPAGASREEPAGHFKSSHAVQTVSFRRDRATAPAPVAERSASTASAEGYSGPPKHVEGSSPRPIASAPATRSYSPAVLAAAQRGGVSPATLTSLPGSGLGGRLTKRDMEQFVASGGSAHAAAAGPAEPAAGSIPPEYSYRPRADDRVEPMSAVRRRIAQHMTWSARISPHSTAFGECDMSAAAAAVARDRAARTGEDPPITYTVLAAEAVIAALREFPVLNASVVGESIVFKPEINLGVAVALTDADELIVPVVRRADDLARRGLARAIADLATRARERRLKPEDVQGGTFTLTNPGIFGGIGGTPILHQPQVAILGLGAITKRAVVIDDAIAIRPMMWMSLTFDHRATDGMQAFRFLDSLRRRLESLT